MEETRVTDRFGAVAGKQRISVLDQAIRCHQGGQLAEARRLYKAALRLQSNNFDALHLLGVLEAQRGRYDKALPLIRDALRANPGSDEANFNYGNVLLRVERYDDAIAAFDRALALNPGHHGALVNRATSLAQLGRFEAALSAYDAIIAIHPRDANALNNRAAVLEHLGKFADALACYEEATAVAPAAADAHYARGRLLEQLKRYTEARQAYAKVVAIDPDYGYALGRLAHVKMLACHWPELAQDIALLRLKTQSGQRASDPFRLLGISSEADEQFQCAKAFAADRYPAAPTPLYRATTRGKRDRIRVAYLSADFYEHATAFLTAELFELHDRSEFEIFGISTGPNDRSAARRRIEEAFDTFIDGSNQNDVALAKTLYQSKVDILVDLNGYCGEERTGVLAFRPCPIQVNYLGFPGTMGVTYVDYVVADRIVISEDQHAHYSEKVVYLPDTYQVNDRRRAIAAHMPTREQVGLPDPALVFCCFNNNYKITPEMFGIWTKLLQQIEGSVLWLLQGSAEARENLQREAESRGIAAQRLVFAPYLKLDEHLARHRLADLFLDTLPYGAHTTASDALWAGLPVLTCLGSSFPGRVGASLLNAIGMPELISHSLEEYEGLALKLARDRSLLASIKGKLAENRNRNPLFDTPRFCRHLEAAFCTMHERARRGQPPMSFSVQPLA
jgi:protein O-GlcNAc transferase